MVSKNIHVDMVSKYIHVDRYCVQIYSCRHCVQIYSSRNGVLINLCRHGVQIYSCVSFLNACSHSFISKLIHAFIYTHSKKLQLLNILNLKNHTKIAKKKMSNLIKNIFENCKHCNEIPEFYVM